MAAYVSVIQHLASYLPKWKLNFALLSPLPSWFLPYYFVFTFPRLCQSVDLPFFPFLPTSLSLPALPLSSSLILFALSFWLP